MKSFKWVLIVVFVFFLLATTLLLIREPVLDFIVDKIKVKVSEKYNAELIIAEADFSGIRDLVLKDISLVPENGDTLITIKRLQAKISISKLLRLRPGVRELLVDTGRIQLVRRANSDNFSFLLKRKGGAASDTTRSASTSGFNDRFMGILEKVNELFDERITFRQFRIVYKRADVEEMVQIPELYFDGREFKSSIITSSKEGVNLWLVNGVADPDRSRYDFSLRKTRGGEFALPFFDLFDGFKICFDSAHVAFSAMEHKGNVEMKSDFSIHNLLANHWRIAPGDVRIPLMKFDVLAFADEDSMGLKRGTIFTLNELPVNITASYSRQPERRFRLQTDFNTGNAQDVFNALPEGMFYTFKGFRASGGLAYNLQVDLPVDSPDGLVFNSSMTGDKLKIESYGTENFSKISSPFNFLAMDKERPVRSFEVGPENPYFTPLPFISKYLQDAVLTAEDPSFMNHNGFVEEAFKESIITNIKEKRFARGGSTISMQLVKNVFLSRNKSVSRKIEEIMIVWLMESKRLVSKERMFEVYLNVIEWGPNVYGIGEASRFYFSKSPDELTLPESIFLSSLIPSPKYFRYRFDQNGNLRPYMENYFKLIAGRLATREKIPQVEADSLQPFIKLAGPALEFVQPVDTIPVDTLELIPVVPAP
jgi:hypothetical protein